MDAERPAVQHLVGCWLCSVQRAACIVSQGSYCVNQASNSTPCKLWYDVDWVATQKNNGQCRGEQA